MILLLAVTLSAWGQTRDERVAKAAEALAAQTIEMRRDLHRHPELSNREVRTGRIVAEKLKALGFDDVRTGVARTGVVGVLKGGRPGTVVAWRADMDALPIQETIDVPYKSETPGGVKHACGHDAHVAIGLALAEVLSKMREAIPGTVKFIFQPAEEGPPMGEEGGAPLMVKEGALENPRPKAIFGMHISTWAPAGKISYSSGAAMASSDFFDVVIHGKKVHGATPHMGVDAVVVAAECVSALQTIRSRRIDPTEPIVLSIGSIQGGNRHNILADRVEMQGTTRTMREAIREQVRTMMKQTLAGCTSIYGATFELSFREPGNPVTYNEPALVEESVGSLERVFGAGNVVRSSPVMGAEDFPFYTKVVPGFFWFLGAANGAKGTIGAHHTPEFDVDEAVFVPGVKAAAAQVLDYLERHKQ